MDRLGSLPVAAFALVALNGLYLAAVAFGNITDFGTNWAFVQHVLAMDTTNFGAPDGENLDPDVMWQAIENETVQRIAYIGIIAWETITAVVLLAAVGLAIARWGSARSTARSLATIGLTMSLLLFFGGFIVVGGEWFQMWKSSAWNGLQPAFHNAALAALSLIVLHLPSTHWGPERV